MILSSGRIPARMGLATGWNLTCANMPKPWWRGLWVSTLVLHCRHCMKLWSQVCLINSLYFSIIYRKSSLVDGLQAVYDAVMGALSQLEPKAKLRLLKSTGDIMQKHAQDSTSLKLSYLLKICALVSDIWEGNQKLVQQFLGQFTDCVWKTLYHHPWGTEPFLGHVLVVEGHTEVVQSVIFSHNGSCIVSGSDDQTILIWDAEMGKPVGELFQGHTSVVFSVAFLPDGKHVVSGSVDKTFWIWDAETGELPGRKAILRTHKLGVVCHIFAWWQACSLKLRQHDNSDLGLGDKEASGRAISRTHGFGIVCHILTWWQVHSLRLIWPYNSGLGCTPRETS